MLKILAAAIKELLLLLRDRTGLLVLFCMPAILVVIITLVQENIMELTGQKKTQVLFLDLDQGELGPSLHKQMETGNLELIIWDEREKTSSDVQQAVTAGDFQAGLVLPAGASQRLREETARLFQHDRSANTQDSAATSLLFFVDPGIMAGLRAAVTSQLQLAMMSIAMEAKLAGLSAALDQAMGTPGMPAGTNQGMGPEQLTTIFRRPLLTLAEGRDAGQKIGAALYNPVQQNVPAWALFGMFFTAIPIAGSILLERRSGIWVRLMSLPVSPVALFTGKTAAYMAICLCQFLLIALIGAFLFPLIGLPAFTVTANQPAVLLVVMSASLAACGFGILLGTICTSYEQASTLGATIVVAAAAIGGVMVPVYAMPHTMQRLSIISPLNWGLTALHDLILRQAPLSATLDDLTRLLIFFLTCIFFAWKLSRNHS
jgi:ABC-2 type transport system permease protein